MEFRVKGEEGRRVTGIRRDGKTGHGAGDTEIEVTESINSKGIAKLRVPTA